MDEQVVGGQRLIERLGEGGMGVVYRARDEVLERETAVKMLHPRLSQQREIVQRFFNEARAAAALRHVGIVEIYSFGYHTDGSAFLVMELLDGESLEARLAARGALPPAAAARIAASVSSALAAAHRKRIVHRDLKPDNIYLISDPDFPGGERIKILDFGVAKLAGDARPGVATQAGMVLGTPDYMAPEQCRGELGVDWRADLYALGCILFRMLCGRPPFLGEAVGDILAAHVRDPPPRPRELVVNLPPALEAIVLRLLAKNREDRFQSAEEVREALLSCVADAAPLTPAVAPSAAPVLEPPARSASPPRALTPSPAAGEVQALEPVAHPPRSKLGAALMTAGALIALGSIAGVLATRRGDVEVLAGVEVTAFEPPREEPATLEACTGEICVERARRHELGGDLELDYARAAELYMHACTSGSAEGCERIGHFHGHAIGVEYDRALAREYLRRACNEERADGCAELGVSLVGEHAGAEAYLERGCESGHATACLAQARLVPMPAARALRLRERARAIARTRCQSGIAHACATMVSALRDAGLRSERDEAAAMACERDQPLGCALHPSLVGRWRPLMSRACEAGHGQMCADLADRLLADPDAAQDRRLAVEYLWMACARRLPAACSRLWQLDIADRRITVAPERLDASCEHSPRTCAIAGKHLASHGDRARGLELFVRGCEGGSADACVLAVGMFEFGVGTRDPVQASAMRDRWGEIQSAECRDDVVVGCLGLGRYYRAIGQIDRARASYDRACVAKNRAACAAAVALEADESTE